MYDLNEKRVECPRCTAGPWRKMYSGKGCALCYDKTMVRESVRDAYKARFRDFRQEVGEVDRFVWDFIQQQQKADKSPQVVCPSCRDYHWDHRCPMCGGVRLVSDWLAAAHTLRGIAGGVPGVSIWLFLAEMYVL